MKIKIIRPTVADNRAVFPDQVIDTSEETGRFLVSIGKASRVAEKPREKASANPVKETSAKG